MSVSASPDSPIERIRQNLVALRMPRALEALDGVVRQLERGATTPIEAIDTLLAEELTVREGRRIKAALQMARLATIKTLAGFDFSFQPSLDRNRIMALARQASGPFARHRLDGSAGLDHHHPGRRQRPGAGGDGQGGMAAAVAPPS